jgi:hypothetical protein
VPVLATLFQETTASSSGTQPPLKHGLDEKPPDAGFPDWIKVRADELDCETGVGKTIVWFPTVEATRQARPWSWKADLANSQKRSRHQFFRNGANTETTACSPVMFGMAVSQHGIEDCRPTTVF